jgi:chromosome segregation ATPase
MICALVAAAAVAAVRSPWGGAAADPQSGGGVEQLADRLRELQAEQSRLREELEDVRAGIAHGSESSTSGAAELQPGEGERVSPEERAVQERKQREERIAKIVAEERDPTWSIPAEDSLRRAFADAAQMGVAVGDVACRSTFCRLDVEVEASEDVELSITRLMALMPWNSHAFYETDEAGRLQLFIARDVPDARPSF